MRQLSSQQIDYLKQCYNCNYTYKQTRQACSVLAEDNGFTWNISDRTIARYFKQFKQDNNEMNEYANLLEEEEEEEEERIETIRHLTIDDFIASLPGQTSITISEESRTIINKIAGYSHKNFSKQGNELIKSLKRSGHW